MKKDSDKSLSDLYGISQTNLAFKLQLLELPDKIITQLMQSSQNYYPSNKNDEKNITQVINLTETHCRYIYQLCNYSEIDKLFDSVYDDFKNEGALKLWEEQFRLGFIYLTARLLTEGEATFASGKRRK